LALSNQPGFARGALARSAMLIALSVGLAVTVLPLVAVASPPPAKGTGAAVNPQPPMGDDDRIKAARQAHAKGDLKRLSELASVRLKDHPLADYPAYWLLSLKLRSQAPRADAADAGLDTEVQRMLARHEGSLLGDLLRRDWLLQLGERDEFARFTKEFDRWIQRDDPAVLCHAWRRDALAGKPLSAAAQRVLWAPRDLGESCNALFTQLAAAGKLGQAAPMRRLERAIESNSPAAIRFAAQLTGVDAKSLEAALNPSPTTAALSAAGASGLIAIARLARQNPEIAAQALESNGQLSPDERAFAWSQVAAAGMRRLLPQALAWTGRGIRAGVSDETLAWMARAALRAERWPLLADIIDRMSEEARLDPTWRYWRARALRAGGLSRDAEAMLREIAGGFHFYGQLATEDLGELPGLPPKATPPREDEIAQAAKNPGFRRALSFYALDLRVEGNREWNFQLRDMNDRQLLAVATWACRQHVLDRCVNTADRTQQDHDFELRFVSPYRDQVKRVAGERGLDPAWVYGLIRQESRFIMDARSSAGAKGLMQIMPNTGKWIARKLEVRDFRVEQLADMDTNINFGTFYLKTVLDDLEGSPILASAAYNAGPGRPRSWRTTLPRPVEGAIFAEIIPFNETRDYVKKVLSNATIYSALFTGRPQSLKAWLGEVTPRTGAASDIP
jgi:soluble lytic murein transglycosylase